MKIEFTGIVRSKSSLLLFFALLTIAFYFFIVFNANIPNSYLTYNTVTYLFIAIIFLLLVIIMQRYEIPIVRFFSPKRRLVDYGITTIRMDDNDIEVLGREKFAWKNVMRVQEGKAYNTRMITITYEAYNDKRNIYIKTLVKPSQVMRNLMPGLMFSQSRDANRTKEYIEGKKYEEIRALLKAKSYLSD